MASDAVRNNHFGSSVSLSGDTALISDSTSGSVYVFERGELGWVETGKLLDFDRQDHYILPVAFDGNTALVGDAFAPGDPDFPGTAYVFAIPEPSSILLLLTAACCVLLWRWRRR